MSEGANRRAKRGVSAGRTTCPTTGARRPRARKIAQCGAGHGRSHRASSGAHVLPGVLRGVVAAARGALISPPALVGTAPAPRPRSSFNHGMSASYSTPRTPPARAWGSGGAQGRRLRGPGKGHDGPKKRGAAARPGGGRACLLRDRRGVIIRERLRLRLHPPTRHSDPLIMHSPHLALYCTPSVILEPL